MPKLQKSKWHKRASDESRQEVENLLWVNGVDVTVRIDTDAQPLLLGDDEPEVDGNATNREAVIAASLGHQIQDARKRLKLSQRQLGERVEVDQSAIRPWERGAVVPKVDQIFRLDLAFGFQPGTLLVKAGLINADSLARLQRRSGDQGPINVSGIEISFDNDTTAAIRLPPRLGIEHWLELARTMIADEISSGAAATKVTIVQPDDYESEMTIGSKGRNLEEMLRLIEIMLEAQGEVEPPRRYPAFDASEEPF